MSHLPYGLREEFPQNREFVYRFLVIQNVEEIVNVSFLVMMAMRPEKRLHGVMEVSRGGWELTVAEQLSDEGLCRKELPTWV